MTASLTVRTNFQKCKIGMTRPVVNKVSIDDADFEDPPAL